MATTEPLSEPRRGCWFLRRPPLWRVVLVAVLTASLPLWLILATMVDEGIWWHHRRELMRVVMPARSIAQDAEGFRAKCGHYPTQLADFAWPSGRSGGQPTITGLRSLVDGMRALGVAEPWPSMSERRGDDRSPLLIVSGDGERVEILPGGRVAVTQRLAPPADLRPEWLEVLSP